MKALLSTLLRYSLLPVLCLAWACTPDGAPSPPDPSPQLPATQPPGEAHETVMPSASAAPRAERVTLPDPLEADDIELSCLADSSLVANGDFASGVSAWGSRYGRIRHTTETFAGEPGAALIVTSHATGDGGYVAVIGQCVDVYRPGESQSLPDESELLIAGYLAALPGTLSTSLSVFFHAGTDCGGDVLDVATLPATTPAEGWVSVQQEVLVPPGTASIDVVIRSDGQHASALSVADALCVMELDAD